MESVSERHTLVNIKDLFQKENMKSFILQLHIMFVYLEVFTPMNCFFRKYQIKSVKKKVTDLHFLEIVLVVSVMDFLILL